MEANTHGHDATNPLINLKIPPGFASALYPLRVCNSGGSNVVAEAIEWAMDPNGDNDMSDLWMSSTCHWLR